MRQDSITYHKNLLGILLAKPRRKDIARSGRGGLNGGHVRLRSNRAVH